MSWQTILAIGSGGFIGAIARGYLSYLTSLLSYKFPLSTLIVNLIGGFIVGILFALFIHTTWFSPHIKSFLTVGFLGALTTFSTFSIETLLLFEEANYTIAVLNIFFNLFGSLFFTFLGYKITSSVF